jgi:type IV pilus assembly protein PilB
MLLEAGLVSNEQLELALEKQKFTKTTLGETLINDNTIEENDLFRVLAGQYGMKYFSTADLDGFSVEQGKLTKIISQNDALKYRIIPLSFDNRHLKVAIFDPHTLAGVGGFDAIMNFNIDIMLIREGDFYQLFEKLYGAKPVFETPIEEIGAIEELGFKEIEDTSEQSYSKYVGGEKDNEAKKLLNIIISYSVKIGASDIHLESDVNGFTVRLRVDGMLRPLTDRTLSPRINAKASAIINRIKVLSKLDIAERRIPQDGAFRLSYFDKNLDQNISIDFRVATCATEFGEGATIRVIDPTKASVRLDQLGHSTTMLRELTDYLKSLSGMFLITGPTGSGKTSTIYAMLNYLSGPEVKVVTAEDPVEYKIPGAFQSQVNRKIGLTFARLLKSFLRMDPDVILLGEIRDKETSEIALDAAMTGHMLISSLHTGDAIGAISRLRDLGISNLVIANALKGVISQRLVRTLCVHCKRPYMPDKKEWESIFPEEPVHLRFCKADGCARCQYTGFRGRSVISEALLLNDELARSILRNDEENKLYTVAKRTNVRFMIDDALAKLDQTTLSEIIRVLPHESISRYKKDQATINSIFPPFKKQEESSLESFRPFLYALLEDCRKEEQENCSTGSKNCGIIFSSRT